MYWSHSLLYASAVGDAISNAISSVTADLKIIVTAIFTLLTFITAIAFVVVLIMELIHYKQQKEVDWMRLLCLLIALVICSGGAALSFTIGGVGA